MQPIFKAQYNYKVLLCLKTELETHNTVRQKLCMHAWCSQNSYERCLYYLSIEAICLRVMQTKNHS